MVIVLSVNFVNGIGESSNYVVSKPEFVRTRLNNISNNPNYSVSYGDIDSLGTYYPSVYLEYTVSDTKSLSLSFSKFNKAAHILVGFAL